jgi:hypothetical protein
MGNVLKFHFGIACGRCCGLILRNGTAAYSYKQEGEKELFHNASIP